MLLATSPTAVCPGDVPSDDIVKVLAKIKAGGTPVGIISNHAEPAWFEKSFEGTDVQFLRIPGRQNGKIIARNTDSMKLAPHDALVLAANREDVQMGKNGGAVLVAAGWSSDNYVNSLGIRVDNALELEEVVELSKGWSGGWWFAGNEPEYAVYALTDLSSYNKSVSQQMFSSKVTDTVKGGGPRLKALLTVVARSLLASGVGSKKQLMWGVYPSSHSANNDTDVLSDFTHRLRTTVSDVRYAKRSEPLFIRHRPSAKRSAGGGSNREDPAEQIETLHLNPAYRGKCKGRHVIVIDDCTTYGVSFAVAAGFLRAAGAASVSGVALGKFGRRTLYQEIRIKSDPFAPVPLGAYNVAVNRPLNGTSNAAAQDVLRRLLP